MLGTTHSWSVTMQNLLLQFHKKNHDLYLRSIDGYELLPEELSSFAERECIEPDIDIAYTLPRNFKIRYNLNSKLKLGIYNYESSTLPGVWNKSIDYIDYALPSSNFSRQVFIDGGWPKDKCVVIPHGINIDDFKNKDRVKNLKTNKRFKFLNISIPHHRKNIGLLVQAYYKAFSANEDVCLIIKTSLKPPKYRFECDVTKEILNVQRMRENRKRPLPQLEILDCKYESMVPLYNSCDCLVSASSGEGFGLPFLEALAAGMNVIAPACTGQLDFLNKKNSLLVKTNIIKADYRHQYWRPSNGATVFSPELKSLSDQMRNAYDNHLELKKKFEIERNRTINEFTWENAANKILELV